MRKIFSGTAEMERRVKESVGFPPALMMENASAELEKTVLSAAGQNGADRILIAAGRGNNGADGIALARRLYGKIQVELTLTGVPSTEEARLQLVMARNAGIVPVTAEKFCASLGSGKSVAVDCLYGTGFRGTLSGNDALIVEKMNVADAFRVACDIPSGLNTEGNSGLSQGEGTVFRADITVTMGTLKEALFSDTAAEFTGEIITAGLGVSGTVFESYGIPSAFLIEKTDMILPLRRKRNVHKGTFGHTAVIAGEKSGAAIIAAQSALNFGSGLVTLIKRQNGDFSPFTVPPELMVSDSIPRRTTAIVAGPGLGTGNAENSFALIENFLLTSGIRPAVVLDADILKSDGTGEFLRNSEGKTAGTVLTPHPAELAALAEKIGIGKFTAEEAAARRAEIGRKFTELFPDCVIVMKGAVTFISSKGKTMICADGNQSLSKAGSGDVLAGMCGALLAQGYSAENAAVTSVEAHALASSCEENAGSYSLTPQKLIDKIASLQDAAAIRHN